MSNRIFKPKVSSEAKRPFSQGSGRSQFSTATPRSASARLDLTTCHLCSNQLCRPKHLPCIHSFCESCIENYVRQIKESKSSTHVACPVCEMPAATVSHISAKEYAENLPTSTLISTVMSKTCASSPYCGRCKSRGRDSKATSWCGYCAQALCDEHVDYHKDLTTTKVQHPVVKLSDLSVSGNFEFVRKCKFHQTEDMSHFCTDEWTPCCHICAKVMHKGCINVVRLQQIASNIKMDPNTIRLCKAVDTLENETDKMFKDRRKNIERISEQLQFEQDKLREYREKINNHLDELENNLATELTTVHAQKKEELEKEARSFKIKNNTLNYYKLLLENIKENSGNTQAVQELATIRTQTKNMEEEVKMISSKLKWTDLGVSYPYDFVKSITRLGTVHQRITPVNRASSAKTPR